MKAYTDLEQSKKLAKILPLESADMHYHYDFNFNELESIPVITEESDHFVLFPKDVRCWSLSVLLDVLTYPDIKQRYDGNWVCRVENKDTTYLWIDSNPVDACVAMIIKLHELNLL